MFFFLILLHLKNYFKVYYKDDPKHNIKNMIISKIEMNFLRSKYNRKQY